MSTHKNEHIILVKPPSLSVEDDRLEPPLGLLYMASVLKENGYESVTILDLSGCKNEFEIASKIDAIPEANIYGISSFCTDYKYVKKIVAFIKQNYAGSLIVIGGPNPTALPAFTLEDSGASVVIKGEGEDAFLWCIENYLCGADIKGILQGKPRVDIDSYPFPSRELVDMNSYSRKLNGRPVISLLSSRGCKYKCIHCNSTVMGAGSQGIRYRSPENIVDEINSLRDSYCSFRFNDDLFTSNPNLPGLLTKLKALDIQFRIFARIEDLNDRNCKMLKEAGCVHISVGIESLNPENLRILGKASQIGKQNNLRIAKSHGLTIRAFFMVGLPFDTDETIAEYFEQASRLDIDEYTVYPLIPYPGTRIWLNPEKYGYTIKTRDFTNYIQIGPQRSTCYALDHANFDDIKVRKWKQITELILESGGILHMKESKIAN